MRPFQVRDVTHQDIKTAKSCEGAQKVGQPTAWTPQVSVGRSGRLDSAKSLTLRVYGSPPLGTTFSLRQMILHRLGKLAQCGEIARPSQCVDRCASNDLRRHMRLLDPAI